MDAVRLGFADEIGSDAQAFEKAAELAGIANYEKVNVNVEVNRLFIQDLRRIYSANGDAETPLTEADARLMDVFVNRQTPSLPGSDELFGELGDVPVPDAPAGTGQWVDLEGLKRPLEQGVLGVSPEQAFPELPVESNRPRFYYLHLGASP